MCLNLWLSVFLKLRIADTFFEPPECCVWINCWGLGRSTSLHKPYTARGKGWELIVVDGWTVNSQCIKPLFIFFSTVHVSTVDGQRHNFESLILLLKDDAIFFFFSSEQKISILSDGPAKHP